ncbi:unnamed protein product [Caenorhabditis sp. 36 PRJEB53466]|nr:unnamed protein product [Caenorhabditis sp. 36 PRJEB53466]
MDLESHLSGSRIRTQVLKFSGFADALFFFYVDQTYLLEVQGVDGGQKMITSTRKLRFRSKKHQDGYPENNGFDTTYCFSKRAKNGAVPVLVERAKRKGFRVAEPDPNGITWIQHNPNFFSYIRTTECGVVIRRLSRRFEPENTDETAAEHMIPMIDGVCPVQLIYENARQKMIGWNHLPLETRHEIIKKMPLRTRFCFRHVAKSAKLAVDSVPLYIPRVSLKTSSNDAVDLLIFTSIGKVTKLKFLRKTDRVLLHVIDPVVDLTKSVGNESPMLLAIYVLKHLAMNPKTTLGTLECYIENWSSGHYDWPEIDRVLGNAQFRTKVVHYSGRNVRPPGPILASRLHPAHLVEVRTTRPPSNKELAEMRQFPILRAEQIPLTLTKTIRVRCRPEDVPKFKEFEQRYTGTGLCPAEWQNSVSLYKSSIPKEYFVKEEQLGPNDVVLSYLTAYRSAMMHTRVTACGCIIKKIKNGFELENPYTAGVCARRWACQIHGDRFDHWYQRHKSTDITWELADSTVEHIIPVLNGVCPVTKYIDDVAAEYKLWKKTIKNKKTEESEREELRIDGNSAEYSQPERDEQTMEQ